MTSLPPKASALDLTALVEMVTGLADSLKDPATLARLFSEMDDDRQAQFFVHVAQCFDEYPGGRIAGETQRCFIGNHLRDCECSTEAAREWVRSLAWFMEQKATVDA